MSFLSYSLVDNRVQNISVKNATSVLVSNLNKNISKLWYCHAGPRTIQQRCPRIQWNCDGPFIIGVLVLYQSLRIPKVRWNICRGRFENDWAASEEHS